MFRTVRRAFRALVFTFTLSVRKLRTRYRRRCLNLRQFFPAKNRPKPERENCGASVRNRFRKPDLLPFKQRVTMWDSWYQKSPRWSLVRIFLDFLFTNLFAYPAIYRRIHRTRAFGPFRECALKSVHICWTRAVHGVPILVARANITRINYTRWFMCKLNIRLVGGSSVQLPWQWCGTNCLIPFRWLPRIPNLPVDTNSLGLLRPSSTKRVKQKQIRLALFTNNMATGIRV